MSHSSPATYLVWSILVSLSCLFLLFHLWSFDRFQCLKWNTGSSGAFKRVMTYSYMITVPLMMIYAYGFTIIKYQQGFIEFEGAIIPKPYNLWPESDQRVIFPLMLVFSLAWGLEMITHLEELCFWFFLVNSGSVQQDWFRSWYFRSWIFGSVVAIVYMPLLTIATRDDPLRCEAYTVLGGSLGSLSLTLWFTPVLYAFPTFLDSLKREGVDIGTIVRLTKFHELNMIRIVFRFIFVIPFIILGVDGIKPHHHINEIMLWTDFLIMIAAFGVCISSALTLIIFFPRSIEGEIALKDAARERRLNRANGGRSGTGAPYGQTSFSSGMPGGQLPAPSQQRYSLDGSSFSLPQKYEDERGMPESLPKILPPMRPNRRRGEDVEMGGFTGLTEANISQHNMRRVPSGKLNPMVHNFRSPIDLYEVEPQLAFTQRW
ncbi:hypothetical protein B0H17DRAFT_1013292 [Mycena rosella]|uniref:Uncharacterized protein n=1 Tax=Mycena rosella TaxID=1033263 RepID=A0AAD7GFS3_MYCRO|nr:hypothetical protein B0H17DRAFT_1013292 [Mycena rosella]